MKIYTRTGDDGTTSLAGGERVPKYSNRVEAYGSVDELIAWFGVLRSLDENKERSAILLKIQDELMGCACSLAYPPGNPQSLKCLPDEDIIRIMEQEIDAMDSKLPALRNFILPGGNLYVSYCNVARCVCRRAERNVIRLGSAENVPEIIPKLLNRTSDYLFILSRMIAFELDIEEIKWSV